MNLVLPEFANSSSQLSGLRKLSQRAFAISLILVTAFAIVSNEPVWASPGEKLFNDQDLPSEMEAKRSSQKVPSKNIFRERYVRVNLNLLREPDILKGKDFNVAVPFGGAVKLNLFADTEYNVVLNSAQRTDSGSTMFLGHVEGSSDSRVALFAGNGIMTGTITTGSGPVRDKNHFLNGADAYRIICFEDISCIISQEKPTPLGHDEVREVSPSPKSSTPNGLSPQSVLVIPDSGDVIDVLVLYTLKAVDDAKGLQALLNQITNAANLTNLIYANSGIPLTINIVGKVQINDQKNINEVTKVGTPLFTDYISALSYIEADPTIAHIRDDYSADLVSLVLSNDLFSNGAGGLADIPVSIPKRTTTSGLAFSVVSQSQIDATGEYALAHELAHNMGARHEIGGSATANSPYPYNFAHVETGLGFATVMFSGNNPAYPTVTTRIPYFSNPNIKYNGVTQKC
jgi:peptidyl-Asp metalloendopeptidase